MRLALLLAPLLLAGCGGDDPEPDPVPDDVPADLADRWPESAGDLQPVEEWQQDSEDDTFLAILDGAESVDLYTLSQDHGDSDPWDVLIVRADEPLAPERVCGYRLDIVNSLGLSGDLLTDVYLGDDGLHGSGRSFSLTADGAGVLVFSSLSDDQAHAVAEALGSEDDDAEPCDGTG